MLRMRQPVRGAGVSVGEPLADAWRLRELLARREVSSRELVRGCLERIERLDETYGRFGW
jgi:hypothetical protein